MVASRLTPYVSGSICDSSCNVDMNEILFSGE